MIEINSYLRLDGEFVPVESINVPIQGFYVSGAIELNVNGITLLGVDEWDYVDQLWAYLIDGVETIRQAKPFTTFFPDQPIRVDLTPERDILSIKVSAPNGAIDRKAEARTTMFSEAMIAGGLIFFSKLAAQAKGKNLKLYKYMINKINNMRTG